MLLHEVPDVYEDAVEVESVEAANNVGEAAQGVREELANGHKLKGLLQSGKTIFGKIQFRIKTYEKTVMFHSRLQLLWVVAGAPRDRRLPKVYLRGDEGSDEN